ncbi:MULTISPECIES: carbohydrate ABC transporter permease [Levilactobacillus]|uniref:ABC transporter permease n=3 Tax=Levilactobacillus TaxID=2767886 RepID=A0AAC9ER66_9LACO|nr:MULTISPECIES: carbohydrate ABC transporter permease [Levilactobacillus]AKP65204.1 ABC transporter permease [Levilactobacillus koreensis]KRK91933.1 ABC-type maltose transport system, permease component [Levilactobacillus koreensis JCM 16448]
MEARTADTTELVDSTKKSNYHRNKVIKSIIFKVIMSLLILIVVFPFLWLLLSSFKYEKDIITYPPHIFSGKYTFQNYIKVWDTIPLLGYVKNTVIFAGATMLISLVLDSMTGYALARMEFKGKTAFYYFVMVSMMIPFMVYMIPLFIEMNKMNLLDTYTGLIVPRATTAFGIFMMRSNFVGLPRDLDEAARLDGLNEWRIFTKIMLPLSKPTLMALAVFTLTNNWNDLLYPLILTTTSSMRTLPAGLALFTGQHISFYGPVMAGAVISMLPLFIIYIFAQKYFVQGSAMSGMKE